MKFIEDYRNDDYLNVVLFILSFKNKPQIELTYNEYSNHGFYNTISDIGDLENGKNFINKGKRTSVSISMWYLSLEAYVNSICKTVGIIKSIEIKGIIKKEISGRIRFLIDELGFENRKLEIKKTGIFNRVNEFREFRNEIFHDRNFGTKMSFNKTIFYEYPNQCNQIDTLQAIKIFIEIVDLFRFSIPGLDLMPNIAIGNNKVFHFEKLDILFKNIISPFFKKVLEKRELETNFDLSIQNHLKLPMSNIFNMGEIVPAIKGKQDGKYKNTTDENTNIGGEIYNTVLSSYNLPDGHSSGLNFIKQGENINQRFPLRKK